MLFAILVMQYFLSILDRNTLGTPPWCQLTLQRHFQLKIINTIKLNPHVVSEGSEKVWVFLTLWRHSAVFSQYKNIYFFAFPLFSESQTLHASPFWLWFKCLLCFRVLLFSKYCCWVYYVKVNRSYLDIGIN